MKDVTGAVTGRHRSSDETTLFDPDPVTGAVTPLYLPYTYAPQGRGPARGRVWSATSETTMTDPRKADGEAIRGDVPGEPANSLEWHEIDRIEGTCIVYGAAGKGGAYEIVVSWDGKTTRVSFIAEDEEFQRTLDQAKTDAQAHHDSRLSAEVEDAADAIAAGLEEADNHDAVDAALTSSQQRAGQ